MPPFPDCAVVESPDARVFTSHDKQHVIVFDGTYGACVICQSSTCHFVSHARALMAPVIPEYETCPRCGGDGVVLTGTGKDPETGIYDTATVPCRLCHATGRVDPYTDAEFRSTQVLP